LLGRRTKSFNRVGLFRHSTDVNLDSSESQLPVTVSYGPATVDACRRGERDALQQVLRAESSALQRVLMRIVGRKSDVDDLLQLTFEHAIRAFPAFRGEASVRTWLTRIAVRTAMHELKHPSRKRRVAFDLIEGGQSMASSSHPQKEAEARARLRALYEHLDKLEPTQRTAFVLFQVEGRSMEEVAALMDSNLSTTKSRVMWARRKLFARLRKDPRTNAWLSEYGEEAP
jgi:RNA polymerase sigma-70 factor (ECF subfamily)